MNIISSVVRASQPVSGDRVDRDVTLEVRAFSVDQARSEAVTRFGREHPEASLEVTGHSVLKRPRQGRTWTDSGTYQVVLRAQGLIENLA